VGSVEIAGVGWDGEIAPSIMGAGGDGVMLMSVRMSMTRREREGMGVAVKAKQKGQRRIEGYHDVRLE